MEQKCLIELQGDSFKLNLAATNNLLLNQNRELPKSSCTQTTVAFFSHLGEANMNGMRNLTLFLGSLCG